MSMVYKDNVLFLLLLTDVKKQMRLLLVEDGKRWLRLFVKFSVLKNMMLTITSAETLATDLTSRL